MVNPDMRVLGCSTPVISIVCGGASTLAKGIVSTFFSTLASWVASAAAWLLSLVGRILSRSTTPPVTAAWFLRKQRLLVAVAAPVGLLALVGAALHAVLHGSVAELWRTLLVRLPLAFLLGAAGAGIVGLALAATDQLCTMLASGDGTSLEGSIKALVSVTAATGALPGLIAVVVAGLVILGSLVLWIELIVRAAAITIATALLPLVLAASLWPPAVAWARRLAETLGALIVSKAVIVLVLSIALDAIANAGGGASTALTGGALLLLAGFMPYAVLRIVPAVESAAVSHLESVRHRATGAVRQATGRAVSLAVGATGGTAMPSVDPVGSNPIGMLEGIEGDITKGTPLDPEMKRARGRPPIIDVPASAGTHVWERDRYGPRLVWKPPGWRDDR